MRILLVEDDPLLGDGLVAGLREMGLAVDWLRDGKQADRVLEDVPYDAAVLDLGLPGLDGMTLLARWRARGIAIPVLILTARDAIDSRVEGLDTGADDYRQAAWAGQQPANSQPPVITPRHGFSLVGKECRGDRTEPMAATRGVVRMVGQAT